MIRLAGRRRRYFRRYFRSCSRHTELVMLRALGTGAAGTVVSMPAD